MDQVGEEGAKLSLKPDKLANTFILEVVVSKPNIEIAQFAQHFWVWLYPRQCFLKFELLHSHSICTFQKSEPLCIQALSWKEGDLYSCKTFKLVEKRKEPRNEGNFCFLRKSSPSVVSEDKREPRAAEKHEDSNLINRRNKLRNDRDLKVPETMEKKLQLLRRQVKGRVREGLIHF